MGIAAYIGRMSGETDNEREWTFVRDLGAMKQRQDDVQHRLDLIEQRLLSIEKEASRIEPGLKSFSDRLDGFGSEISEIKGLLKKLADDYGSLALVPRKIDAVTERVDRLETSMSGLEKGLMDKIWRALGIIAVFITLLSSLITFLLLQFRG